MPVAGKSALPAAADWLPTGDVGIVTEPRRIVIFGKFVLYEYVLLCVCVFLYVFLCVRVCMRVSVSVRWRYSFPCYISLYT